MARVLIIDDDTGLLLRYKGMLRAAGHEVATAALGEDGVAAAQRDQFDVVLCDQRLRDKSGIEVVGQIHKSCPRSRIVFATAWVTPELIAQAMRAGATTYAAKPLSREDLVSVINDAQRLHTTKDAIEPNRTGYAARRWVDLIMRGVVLPDDPRTVMLWCRSVGTARSTLQHRCDAVQLTPRDSLGLVRLLRVVTSHAGELWDLQSWLDIADHRTARALMERAGLQSGCPRVPDYESFLTHQRLIVEPALVEALRTRLFREFPGVSGFDERRSDNVSGTR